MIKELEGINATATDYNREQTEKICEINGWKYLQDRNSPYACDKIAFHQDLPNSIPQVTELPNGSFTLCRVVGMLKERGVVWSPTLYIIHGYYLPGWCKDGKVIIRTRNPHDLTAAMKALIRIEKRIAAGDK